MQRSESQNMFKENIDTLKEKINEKKMELLDIQF